MPARAAILARDGTVLAHGRRPQSTPPTCRRRSSARWGRSRPTQLAAYEERGIPADDDGRRQRARADLRPPAARHARAATLLAGTHGARPHQAAPGPRRAHDDLDPGRSARRPRRSAAGSAASSRSSRAPARCSPSPGSRSRASSRPARRSRSSRTTGALGGHVAKPSTVFPVAAERDARAASSSTTPTARTAAARWRSPSPSRATRCSRRSAPSSAPSGSSTSPSASASTRRPASRARPRARSRPPGDIGDDLAVGSSAIGQGRVQATTLQMALVAATIALKGRRPAPTLVWHAAPQAGQDDAGDDAPTSRGSSSS